MGLTVPAHLRAQAQAPATYAVHESPAALKAALALAQGEYQRALVLGQHSLSGSTVGPKYWARYKRSADALVARLEAAGLGTVIRVRAGRRVLVIWKSTEGAKKDRDGA